MFPPYGLSDKPTVGEGEVPSRPDPRIDYAMGTDQLNQPNKPRTTLWSVRYQRGTIYLKPQGGTEIAFLQRTVSELAFALDRDMLVVLAYRIKDDWFLYHFDAKLNKYIEQKLPAGVRSVRCVFDLNHFSQALVVGEPSIFYFRDKTLYRRSHLDHYVAEMTVATYEQYYYLEQATFNEHHRIQLKIYELVEPADLEQVKDPIRVA